MSDWPLRTLREVCVGVYDGPHATPPKAKSGPLFLGISNLNNGRLDLTNVEYIEEASWERWTRRVTPQAGDIVFSYETRLGQAAQIRPGLRCCLGRRLGLLRPDTSKIDPRFLLYSYLSPDFQDFLATRTLHGSTVDRLPVAEFPDFRIPVPELPIQQATAAILGALDDRIELNDQTNRTLEGLAATFFRQWMEQNESGVRERKVQELIDEGVLYLNDGYRAKNSEVGPGGLPFARAGNLNGGFHFDGADILACPGVKAAGEKIARDFDCVFTSKGSVGRIAVVLPSTPRFVYSPQLCFWRSRDPKRLHPLVLLQWMRGSEFRDQVDAVKGQTDMADYVNLRDQRMMSVSLPWDVPQEALSERLAPLISLVDVNTSMNRTLAVLRDTLLGPLFSGEITLNQAEQTVASVE